MIGLLSGGSGRYQYQAVLIRLAILRANIATRNKTVPFGFWQVHSEAPPSVLCTIPEGKAIFFSPINAECSFAEYQDVKYEAELRECAKAVQDAVEEMEVSVDGIRVENLEQYRVQSSIFAVELPENNVFGIPATKTQAVSDGNWVFLKPLPLGEHIIKSKGSAGEVVTPQGRIGAFSSDVTYHLIVK